MLVNLNVTITVENNEERNHLFLVSDINFNLFAQLQECWLVGIQLHNITFQRIFQLLFQIKLKHMNIFTMAH